MAGGIDYVFRDPDLAYTLAENGHDQVVRRVDWNALANNLLAFAASVRK
jgi:hypothetical protein